MTPFEFTFTLALARDCDHNVVFCASQQRWHAAMAPSTGVPWRLDVFDQPAAAMSSPHSMSPSRLMGKPRPLSAGEQRRITPRGSPSMSSSTTSPRVGQAALLEDRASTPPERTMVSELWHGDKAGTHDPRL